MPCVVGPTPYYKVWQLNSTLVLRTPGGRPMENIVYTFDFFDPWDYVTSDSEHGFTFMTITNFTDRNPALTIWKVHNK